MYSDGSSICYSTVTLKCELLTPKFNAFISVPLPQYILGVSLVKIRPRRRVNNIITSPETATTNRFIWSKIIASYFIPP